MFVMITLLMWWETGGEIPNEMSKEEASDDHSKKVSSRILYKKYFLKLFLSSWPNPLWPCALIWIVWMGEIWIGVCILVDFSLNGSYKQPQCFCFSFPRNLDYKTSFERFFFRMFWKIFLFCRCETFGVGGYLDRSFCVGYLRGWAYFWNFTVNNNNTTQIVHKFKLDVFELYFDKEMASVVFKRSAV